MQITTTFYIFSSTVNCPRTLVRWEQDGKINAIKTPSGQRRYDIDSYIQSTLPTTKKTVLYCRVSSNTQKPDLNKQLAKHNTNYY